MKVIIVIPSQAICLKSTRKGEIRKTAINFKEQQKSKMYERERM